MEQREMRRNYRAKRQEDQRTGGECWGNRERGGDTPELRDRMIRRQEESIVQQEERRRYCGAERQEDWTTGAGFGDKGERGK